MSNITFSNLRVNPIEMFLGLGLGLGYMTSLRFAGFVGISEILILCTWILLFRKFGVSLYKFDYSIAGIIKIYMLISVFIILPVMTFVTIAFTELHSSPQYIISFIIGVTLVFLLVEGLNQNRINMGNVVLWFALAYISTSFLSIFVLGSNLGDGRYSGAAENPNQLMFYASCLSLLLVIYRPKISFFILPIIIYITSKTGSDAYFLSLLVTVFIYFFVYIFFSGRISFGLGFFISFIVGAAIVFYVFFKFIDEIIFIWSVADEGNARTNLMQNAFLVTLTSPLFGYGAGSFSGLFEPFSTWEAHNTFLDFSMQFGLIFPSIIYFVFFCFLFNRIKEKMFLQAAFVAAFIVSGLFHFTGRHFFFWVEFAIFYHYIFFGKRKYNKPTL